MVCIDGAHVPGQLDLNIASLNPDFFVGNLHKWCYAMRGCALIYVAKEHQENCHPIATSHNYKCDFQERFFDQGTDDITNYLIVPEALEYYHSIGGRDPNSVPVDSIVKHRRTVRGSLISGREALVDHANNMLEPLRRVSRIMLTHWLIAQAIFGNLLRKRLCDELGCEMYPVPNDMEAPFMRIVRLEQFKIFSIKRAIEAGGIVCLRWSVNT